MNMIVVILGFLFLGVGVYLFDMTATVWQIVQGVLLGIVGVIAGIVSVFFLSILFNRYDLSFYLLGMLLVETGLTVFAASSFFTRDRGLTP